MSMKRTPEWLAEYERKRATRIGSAGTSHLQWKAQEAAAWNGNVTPVLLKAGGAICKDAQPEDVSPVGTPAPINARPARASSLLGATVPSAAGGAPLQRREADAVTREDAARRLPARGISPSAAPLLERDVLKAVREALELHPRVAWVARLNSGRFEVDGRWIQASFKGCSDLLFQTVDGIMGACEAKSSTGKPTADQAAFLHQVRLNNGIAFIARSVDDVYRVLGEPKRAA